MFLKILALGKPSLGFCASLQELPDSIGKPPALVYLCLENCSRLHELPESLAQAKSFEEVVTGGTRLQDFPSRWDIIRP